MENKSIVLGQQIQFLRKRKGKTQEELAEKVGVSTKHIQFIESSRRVPSLNTIYKIANALEVHVYELFPF